MKYIATGQRKGQCGWENCVGYFTADASSESAFARAACLGLAAHRVACISQEDNDYCLRNNENPDDFTTIRARSGRKAEATTGRT